MPCARIEQAMSHKVLPHVVGIALFHHLSNPTFCAKESLHCSTCWCNISISLSLLHWQCKDPTNNQCHSPFLVSWPCQDRWYPSLSMDTPIGKVFHCTKNCCIYNAVNRHEESIKLVTYIIYIRKRKLSRALLRPLWITVPKQFISVLFSKCSMHRTLLIKGYCVCMLFIICSNSLSKLTVAMLHSHNISQCHLLV